MLDTPNRDWEALADSLGLGGLRLVFEKHPQPAGYFLENLDVSNIQTYSYYFGLCVAADCVCFAQ